MDRRASRRRGQHRVRSGRPPQTWLRRTCGAVMSPGKTGPDRHHIRRTGPTLNTFANALRSLGIEQGQRVFSLCWAVPAVCGDPGARSRLAQSSRLRCSSAFGPEPTNNGWCRQCVAMVTSAALYRKKVAPVRDEIPTLQHILLVRRRVSDDVSTSRAIHLTELLAEQSDRVDLCQTGRRTWRCCTSPVARPGPQSRSPVAHAAVVAHYATWPLRTRSHAEDICWCTASRLG